MELARFSRGGGSQILGCIVYLLLAPVLGFILGCAAGGLVGALVHAAGASEDAATVVGVVTGSLALIACLAWAFRDFRRRAFLEVVVYSDAVEVGQGKSRTRVAFSDVRSMRLEWEGSVLTCSLAGQEGNRVRLPAAVAPFDKVQPLLNDVLIAGLVKTVREELDRGQSVRLGESVGRAYLRVVYAVLLIPLAGFAFLSIKNARAGFDMIRFSRRLIRQGWRGRRGGFSLTREGPVLLGDDLARPMPWAELRQVALDGDGIVLESLEGQQVSASLHAENYLPVSRWVQERLGSTSSS